MKKIIDTLSVAIAAVIALFPSPSSAKDYPSHPIRMVVPYSAGGPSDTQARLIGQKLSEILKQSVIVENHAGAAGNIGAGMVANAKPDGYTLLFSSTGPLMVNPHIFSNMPFDPLKDLAPISLISFAPSVLAVNPNVSAANIDELISLLKANPDKYSYASGGEGTTQHLSGELLKDMASLKMNHIPYKGEGPATIDVLGDHVPIIFISVGTGLPNFKRGLLRPLAVTSLHRNPALPDIPTLAESGFPGYEVTAWQGVFAPAGTPRDIINKLNAALRSSVGSPDIAERFTSVGNVSANKTVEEFSAFLQKEVPHWAKLVKQAGVAPIN
ncbi:MULTISPECIES: Bug family tripartite tricarboxylate transporter substrate binding protein [Alcaligenaceae]|uniref:Secreted protein n=1 Tax=Bordetella petrii (strain ATCC BAA-461 / DSM 12804 / CCUG 43448 / CIP 107267 / Se-1111R) TaxID=340100 RepID=A9ICF0_BORPD|nr:MULTISPECIES: tripartite tricarboxylate transporter substrate binding protein [Alcaligenaceae]CAP41559.1 putative secreted protein [Bordetella petrii]CUJ31251.1 Argininosuccinate lyase [Achromobacter xylosoxidans]CUJ71328.1 Argininosuccinate lyase [Achromobacter xylosoxidans]